MSEQQEYISPNRIGNLNGKWSILFRATMVAGALALPLFTAWATWTTSQIFAMKSEQVAFMAVGPRYTSLQAQIDHAETRRVVLDEIEDNYPPQWLRDAVASLTENQRTTNLRLNQLELDMRGHNDRAIK